jgi:hypothetical protein
VPAGLRQPARQSKPEPGVVEAAPGSRSDDVAHAQAAMEGVSLPDHVEFFGGTYRIAPRVPLMALLDFASATDAGVQSDDPRAMSTMRDLLWRCFLLTPPCRVCDACTGGKPNPGNCMMIVDGNACGRCPQCVGLPPMPESCPKYDAGDWPAFHLAALDNCADEVDLLDVITHVIEVVSARPTRRRSGSSQSGRDTSLRSRADLSSADSGMTSVPDLARSLR